MIVNEWNRTIALERGYTLNEYEICPFDDITGEKGNAIPVHSEKDIFDVIGLDYREPYERDL